jgi:hypothetical protein
VDFFRFSLAKYVLVTPTLLVNQDQLGIAGSNLCVIKLVQLSRRFFLPEYFLGVRFIDSKIFILCVFPSFTCGKNAPS